MKRLLLPVLMCLLFGCTKDVDGSYEPLPGQVKMEMEQSNIKAGNATTTTFTRYTIQKGAHSSSPSSLKSVSGTVMSFIARFDSTAIYPAVITDYNHAYDVNKLFGFSEGFSNQYNSARIGWRWLNGSLQLFAYVYVKGTLLRNPVSYDPPFIKAVNIGTDIQCSIAVSGGSYIFTVDGVVVKTARGTTSSRFSGYQQYPYFGGTLTAPHLMNFYIR